MTVKDIFDLRKQGRVEDAYQAILPMYKVHHGHYTSICMFWCASDMAKLYLERNNAKEAERILASLMRLYPSLEDKDNSARQTLLNLALHIAKSAVEGFSFIEFMQWWGVEHLTDDDWQAAESNGHPLPSRGQKIATQLFHEAREVESIEQKQYVLSFVEIALQHNTRNRNLLRAKAYLLAEIGKKDEAIKQYRYLARYGKEAYIFSELAVLTDDFVEQVALTAKAISLQRSEAFRQKDRLRMATLLGEHRPNHARYELDCVIAQRQASSLHNTRQINQLLEKLKDVEPATRNQQQLFYNKAIAYLTSHI